MRSLLLCLLLLLAPARAGEAVLCVVSDQATRTPYEDAARVEARKLGWSGSGSRQTTQPVPGCSRGRRSSSCSLRPPRAERSWTRRFPGCRRRQPAGTGAC